MPWCPNCKSEYREGIKECAECKIELVDELPEQTEMILLAAAEQEEILRKFSEYLTYSKIDSECRFIEEDSNYGIYVKEADLKRTKKAFAAFCSVELDQKRDEEQREHIKEEELLANIDHVADEGDLPGISYEELDTEEEDSEQDIYKKPMEPAYGYPVKAPSSGKVYVKKSEQSKDLKSTAITFLGFGVALLAFFLLNLLKVITLFSNAFSLVVLIILSILCFLVAANSFSRAKKAAADAILEEELTKKLNEWMKSNMTKKVIDSFADDSMSLEVAYLKKTEGIKTFIVETFGEIDDAYMDQVVEDFYNQCYETTDE